MRLSWFVGRAMRGSRGRGNKEKRDDDAVTRGEWLNPARHRPMLAADERRLLKSVKPSSFHSHFPFSLEGCRRSSLHPGPRLRSVLSASTFARNATFSRAERGGAPGFPARLPGDPVGVAIGPQTCRFLPWVGTASQALVAGRRERARPPPREPARPPLPASAAPVDGCVRHVDGGRVRLPPARPASRLAGQYFVAVTVGRDDEGAGGDRARRC